MVSSAASALWIHGSLGSGKSTLMSLIVDGFLTDLRPQPSAPVVFFYCGNPPRTADECARDMLRQLVQLNPSTSPMALKLAHGAGRMPDGRECLDMLNSIITRDNYSVVTFAIDSLDKMALPKDGSPANALTPMGLLLDLAKLAQRKTNQCLVRILVTTQGRNSGVERVFADNRAVLQAREISVDNEAPNNIRHFVEHIVHNWSSADFLPSEPDDLRAKAKSAVIDYVTRGAGKMYLWAILTLNRIRNNPAPTRERDVQTQLKQHRLPSDILQSYEKICSGLQSDSAGGLPSSGNAQKAMHLLFSARKRLATHALVEAVCPSVASNRATGAAGYQATAQDIIQCSGGLIVEDRDEDVFVFFHPSVEQYLESRPDYLLQSNAAMAKACVSYLLEFSTLAQRARGRGRNTKGPSDSRLRNRSRSRSRSRRRQSRAGGRSRSRSRSRGGYGDVAWGGRRPSRSASRGRQQPLRTNRRQKVSGDDLVLQDFEEYAHIYWATHLAASRAAGKQVADYQQLVTDTSMLLNGRGLAWMQGVHKLLSQRPMEFYGATVELQLQQCMCSHSRAWLLVSAVYGLPELVEPRLKWDRPPSWWNNKEVVNDSGSSALHLAAKFAHIPLLNLLVKIGIYPQVFWERDGEQKYALQHALENVASPPTKWELKAWIELYRTPMPTSEIVPTAIQSAMQNPFCAEELVDVMFRLFPIIQYDNKLLLEAAVSYAHCSVGLLNKIVAADSELGESVLIAAARCSGDTRTLSTRMGIWDRRVRSSWPRSRLAMWT
ncbi:hypothetical protein RB596_003259 [Gaeumannomyces avenae]